MRWMIQQKENGAEDGAPEVIVTDHRVVEEGKESQPVRSEIVMQRRNFRNGPNLRCGMSAPLIGTYEPVSPAGSRTEVGAVGGDDSERG